MSRNHCGKTKNCSLQAISPFPTVFSNDLIDSCKPKESADDNFELGESGRMFSKREEITEGKGEIAHYEQFLLFPQRFQKTY